MKDKMFKEKSMKRILGVILTLALIITLLPIRSMTAYASVAGSGTENDPYIINNVEEFKTQLSASQRGKYYKLADDFDGTAEITETIYEFKGILDGNNKTVKLNISSNSSKIGIFQINSGTISNLNTEGSILATDGVVGGICAFNNGKISQCTNNATIKGSQVVGGICGTNYGDVTECTNHGNITATDNNASGICGANGNSDDDGNVENCTSDGIVTCDKYPEYTGYGNTQMAYKMSADGEIQVIGKVGNEWISIHYLDDPIEKKVYNSGLSVKMTPEIINNGTLLKVTVSVTNETENEINNEKICIGGCTAIGGCIRSDNKTNDNNTLMTMLYSNVAFLVFSNDPDFKIVNTDERNFINIFYYGNNTDAVQINERCNSAYSARWILDSIGAKETATRTFYMSCLDSSELTDEYLNNLMASVHTHDWKYSEAGNKIEAYCAAQGCPLGTGVTNKLSLVLNTTDKIYSGNPYDGVSVTNNITAATGLAAGPIQYVGRDGTNYALSTTAPTNAGKYNASVTIGGQTATAGFAITKQPITVNVAMDGWTYGDEAKAPSITESSNPGSADVTYTYYKDEACTNQTTSVDGAASDGAPPKNAGTYYVKASVAETDNYAGGSGTKEFTIQEKDNGNDDDGGESGDSTSDSGTNGNIINSNPANAGNNNGISSAITNNSAVTAQDSQKESSEESQNIKSPKTGDNFNIALWTILLLVSVDGFFVLFGRRKKKN